MGGGDSKQEQPEQAQPQSLQDPAASKNFKKSKNASPRLAGSINEPKFQERKGQDKSPQKGLTKQLKPGQIGSEDNIQKEQPQIPQYFEQWQPRFHQSGQMPVKILVISLQPTHQFQHLNRQHSQHKGELSWQYQHSPNRQTYLRFTLTEEGDYYLSFAVDEQANAQEGDADTWALMCPFRTSQEISKVGGYNCERIYQSEQGEEQDDFNPSDNQLFVKWEERQVADRPLLRQLFQKRRRLRKLKSQKGFEYRQATKYFTSSQEWRFSVLVEQKMSSFKSWIIQMGVVEDPKETQKLRAMATTLRNDIQTRQNMYIEQMRKKRAAFQRQKLISSPYP